jgi:hypothetical protein
MDKTKNRVEVIEGKVVTVLTDKTKETGYLSIDDAKRLSLEYTEKTWELLKRNSII